MKKFTETYTVSPILCAFSTGGSSSLPKIRINGNEDVCVLIGMQTGIVTTAVTSTAENYAQFIVIEGTAATAGGSAVTNATVSLGCPTAFQTRGQVVTLLKVTSGLTSAMPVTINGQSFQTMAAAGKVGEDAALMLASAINGGGTSPALKHYRAVANYSATGLILIEPTDADASGLAVLTTAGSLVRPFLTQLQGAIELSGAALSTNTPKYVGVPMSTYPGTTAITWVQVIRRQNYSPSFMGR